MKRKHYSNLFVALDFGYACLAWVVFFFVRKIVLAEGTGHYGIKEFMNALVIGVFWMILYFLAGFYVDVFKKSRVKEIFTQFAINFFGVVVIFFTLLIDDVGVKQYTSYYHTVLSYFLIFGIGSIIMRFSYLTYAKSKIANGTIAFNTLIIGSNDRALETYQELNKLKKSIGFRFIAYLHVFEETKELMSGELRHLGGIENLGKVIRRCNIEEIIVAIESSEHHKITDILGVCEEYNIRVSIIPDIYNILIGSVKVNHLLGVPLIEVDHQLMPFWQTNVKRIFDIFFSLSVLIIGSPFYFSVILITKLSSKGPVFFKQQRVGKNEEPFWIYKFRSMYIDAEAKGPQLASDNDPRITPWGRVMRKLRIDEMPQFYNVLKGDMSVVGPRPERQFFIDQIVVHASHYRYLLRVKPGITSLGQVKYGYAENVTEMVRRLKYDIIYLENMSLAMDFRIILYTIVTVIKGRGK